MKKYDTLWAYDFVKGVEPSYLPHMHTVQRQDLFICMRCYQCTNEALVWIQIINALNSSKEAHISRYLSLIWAAELFPQIWIVQMRKCRGAVNVRSKKWKWEKKSYDRPNYSSRSRTRPSHLLKFEGIPVSEIRCVCWPMHQRRTLWNKNKRICEPSLNPLYPTPNVVTRSRTGFTMSY